jgi:hypothetical protein
MVRSSERNAALWARRFSDCLARFFAEAIFAMVFPVPASGILKKGRMVLFQKEFRKACGLAGRATE